jgi:hypothetical protein
MVSDLPGIQSSDSARPLAYSLTYDFSLYDWAVKFLGIFRCYSCLVPPEMLLAACSEKSFVV